MVVGDESIPRSSVEECLADDGAEEGAGEEQGAIGGELGAGMEVGDDVDDVESLAGGLVLELGEGGGAGGVRVGQDDVGVEGDELADDAGDVLALDAGEDDREVDIGVEGLEGGDEVGHGVGVVSGVEDDERVVVDGLAAGAELGHGEGVGVGREAHLPDDGEGDGEVVAEEGGPG